ncbi:MAG: extracellular solute-binding protein, partial [Chloroflexales bacterium]|nr:extracellular solute-binding protein [Chloroflexales bacterium]
MQRILVVALIGATLLAGCQLSAPPPPTPTTGAVLAPVNPGAVTISFAAPDHELPVYRQLAQQFMAEHPAINVVVRAQSALTSLEDTGFAAARRFLAGADTLPSIEIPPELYGANLLLNLAPLLAADPTVAADDFYPGALAFHQTADGLWALPQYQYLNVLYYNKDLFAQANLPAPQAGWRWEDLLAAATQVAAQDGLSGETYGWLEQGNEIVLLLSVLPLASAELFDQPASAVSIDQPEFAAALERMQTLVAQRVLFWYPAWAKAHPTPEPNPFRSTEQLILDGRVGLWSSDNRPVTDPPDGQDGPAAWTPLPFELGVVPYPESSMPLGSVHGYAISGGTAHPQEAWRWIAFLSRQPVPAQNLRSPALPARRSAATATQFGETLDPTTWAAYEWALEHAPSLSLSDMPTLWAVQVLLGDALTQVLDHDVAADQALRAAQAQLPAILAYRPTPAPEDLLPVTVATPPPQTAPPGTTLVRFGAPQHQMQTFQPLANAFQTQHPEILVVVQPLEQDSLAAAAQAMDCLVW